MEFNFVCDYCEARSIHLARTLAPNAWQAPRPVLGGAWPPARVRAKTRAPPQNAVGAGIPSPCVPS